ncbi:P-loop NTPase family protein [Derxia lacustris]|uniref:MinD/ParA family protein n=1 Tax=Derxia lacustris TaxID=764842 RepID=UPI00111BFEE1|nr:MinD/ParA family protein [Derxia lacustris]
MRVLPVVGSGRLACWLAQALAEEADVLVLDHSAPDMGTRFQRRMRGDLADLLAGSLEFADAVVRVSERLALLSARDGADVFLAHVAAGQAQKADLFGGFLALAEPPDWLLINTQSLELAAELMDANGDLVLAVHDDPGSVRETYSRIKAVAGDGLRSNLRIAAFARDELAGRRMFERLAATADRFLDLPLGFGLALPESEDRRTPGSALTARLRAAVHEWCPAEFPIPASATTMNLA